MHHAVELEVLGPWPLATSRRFWLDLAPWPLAPSPGAALGTAVTAGAAQALLPGLRPCGFQSPHEAAVWAVL